MPLRSAHDLLAVAFPFHMVVGTTLEICGFGASLHRLVPDLCAGASLFDHFRIERPRGITSFASLRARLTSQVSLSSRERAFRLRGQFVELDEDRLAFLGSPLVTDLSDLTALDLTLDDFALHDSVSDLALLLQTRKIALEDAENLSRELAEDRERLASLSRLQQTQLAVGELLTRTDTPDGLGAPLLTLLCQRASYVSGAIWLAPHGPPAATFGAPPARWQHLPAQLRAGTSPGFAAETLLPLRVAGEVVGALALEHPAGATAGPAQGDGLAQIAANISGFLERARDRAALNEARLAAESASAAKSAFLASMSHELRTPLNGVLGAGALLADTPLADDQRRLLHVMQRSGDALLGLISDVLDLAKAESGQMDLDPTEVTLRVLVDEVLDVVSPRAAEKGLVVAGVVDPEVPTSARVDGLRLRQVLLNLLGNAAKFTSTGGITLRVDLETPTRLRVAVEDTGPGIDAAGRARLFQRFSQADASITRRHGGTGLGLAISQQIVGLLGGTIHCASEPGAGSTFSFCFDVTDPVVRRPASPRAVAWIDVHHAATAEALAAALTWLGVPCARGDTSRASSAITHLFVDADRATPGAPGLRVPVVPFGDARGGAPGVVALPVRTQAVQALFTPEHVVHPEPKAMPTTRLRALVVDDIPVNRMILVRLLARHGIQAEEAEDGEQAVQKVHAQPWDVVFMDVQMPRLDGLAASRRIRASAARQPFIVACTANAVVGDREDCLAAGMDAFLSKPLRPDALAEIVRGLLAAT